MPTRDPRKHYGKPGNRATDQQKAEVEQLARAGIARNRIAEIVGLSRTSVSGICSRLDPPVSFDRAATKAATEAHKADMAARRAELAAGLLDDVEKLRSQLFAPAVVFNIGGKDNTYTEHEVDEPPAESKLKLMQAVGAAIDRHLKLDVHDSDEHGLAAVDSWLKGMLGD